jgi:hypothetical protein
MRRREGANDTECSGDDVATSASAVRTSSSGVVRRLLPVYALVVHWAGMLQMGRCSWPEVGIWETKRAYRREGAPSLLLIY